jgi:transposase-like protein
MSRAKVSNMLPYYVRIKSWITDHKCPYCGSSNVTVEDAEKKGRKRCVCEECHAENYVDPALIKE